MPQTLELALWFRLRLGMMKESMLVLAIAGRTQHLLIKISNLAVAQEDNVRPCP